MFFLQGHRLKFFKNSRRGKILRAMTLHDVMFWSSDAFVTVIFALYVVQFIEGGNATHVGLSYFVYSLVRGLLSIPVGQFFDKHRGRIDEVWGLALASFGGGIVYILLSQAHEPWHLYVAMFAMGFFSLLDVMSWRVLFYTSLDKTEYAETVGIYETITMVTVSFAVALGGIAGDRFGFDMVVLFGGIMMFVGGFVPLMVRRFFDIKDAS